MGRKSAGSQSQKGKSTYIIVKGKDEITRFRGDGWKTDSWS